MSLEKVKRNIKDNPNIPRKIKEMVISTFSDLYDFLGERGLKKWLVESKLDSISRRLIIRILSSKTDKSLRKRPTSVGYEKDLKDLPKDYRKKIVLRKNIGDNNRTLSHELVHSLGDGFGGFNIFIGEGIAEYISKTIYHNNLYGYTENVDVVSLLIAMYGDRIFKYYFTQRGDQFFYELALGGDLDLQEKVMDNLNIMETSLRNSHILRNYNKQAEGLDPNQELKKGVDAILENYWIYKSNQIKRFKYIKNGKVDFDSFIKEMVEVYNCYSTLIMHNSMIQDLTQNGMESPNAFHGNIEELLKHNMSLQHVGSMYELHQNMDDLIEQLIENSHLLVGLDEETCGKVKSVILQDVSQAIGKMADTYKFENGNIPDEIINQQNEPYRSLNENAREKLLKKFVADRAEETSLAERLETISDIASATNMSQEEVEEAINETSTKQQSFNPEIMMKIAHKYSVALENLRAMEINIEEEMKRTAYVQLELDSMPSTIGFLEVNTENGQINMFLLDSATGEINKISLNKTGEFLPEKGAIVSVCINRDNLPENLKNKDKVFRVQSIESGQSTYIGIPDDLINQGDVFDELVVINGDMVTGYVSFNEMKEECLDAISRTGFLQSAIKATEQSTRTGQIQAQMQIIAQKEDTTQKGDSKNLENR